MGNGSSLFSMTSCKKIGQLLPKNLKHLQLEGRYNIAPESLTYILECCVSKLEIIGIDLMIFYLKLLLY